MGTRVLTFCTLCILLYSLHAATALHLTYFAHETRYGPNKTVLAAAGTGQGNLSAVGWGSIIVVDNAMKSGSTSDSLLLGSIKGIDIVTTIGGVATGGVQASYQHIFKGGSQYNGSSLTLLGTIQTPSPPYECIVPGGTGLLRGYSGYGFLNPVLNATVPPLFVFQWDIYITHKK